MATVAVGQRTGLVARSTTDRALLRTFLERDRLFAAYAICDLEDREFGRTRWGIATQGSDVVAVGMEYGGPDAPADVRHGRRRRHLGHPPGRRPAARGVPRREAASLPAVAQHYRVDPGPPMIRMWVDRARFQPAPAHTERLLPVEIGELNRLYQLGFAAWLPSSAIAEGVYFGIRVNGRLVAAAGTHVISRQARLAVVGNVLTHTDHRGRGYAKAVTSAVTAELLRYCDEVVLNVRSDNPPAIAAYTHLGYIEHTRFEERLVRRLASPWSDLTAPIRRFFARGSARAADVSPTNRPGPSDRPAVRGRPRRGTQMTDAATQVPHDVTDLALADEGVRRIEWAEREMPVLRLIRERFERELPLRGLRIGACLHVTTETANLMRTLKAGGAEVHLAASNPLSTQDVTAAALVAEYGIATYARRGEDNDTYYSHLRTVADTHPADHDGRRLRPRVAAPQGAPRPAVRDPRRDRGDDDGRHPPPRDGRRRRADVPGRRGQRGRDEAPVRQPLRHRPVHDRRHPARDEHPHRGAERRDRRLRLGGQGDLVPDGRATAPTSRSSRSTRSARSRR